MKILIIGGGGREHCLAWKLKQSSEVQKIFVAPGNAGTASIAENVSIDAENISAIADFAESNAIDLTIVGPEAALVAGIVDEFGKRSLKCFGPSKKAAELEGSKLFTRELLKKHSIPSAEFMAFSDAGEAISYVKEKGAPIVVKADGLAAGKGVTVAETVEEAEKAVKDCLLEKHFGTSGETIVIEECLQGEEASFLAFTDGKNVVPMASSQDHKRAYDNDNGPNTGGMGAYSPAPIVSGEMQQKIMDEVMVPTVNAMAEEGRPYKGVLYAGLMISGGQPRALEFNCRFGDPETQVILPRMQSDLLPVLDACIEGTLHELQLEWKHDACCCVVAASGGYPLHYEKGKEVFGLDVVKALKNVFVFHAGTRLEGSAVLTSGGRVLNVTALGDTIKKAIGNAYAGISKISFEGMHFRKDIGFRALERESR